MKEVTGFYIRTHRENSGSNIKIEMPGYELKQRITVDK
jgi:hypothetical protein